MQNNAIFFISNGNSVASFISCEQTVNWLACDNDSMLSDCVDSCHCGYVKLCGHMKCV